MRYALIQQIPNTTEGVVVNVVEWDGSDRWTPPKDVTLVELDNGVGMGTGDVYDFPSGTYWRPVPPDPEVDADGYVLNPDGSRMTDHNGQWITAEAYYGS